MIPAFYGFISHNKYGRPIWQVKYDSMVYFIPIDKWNGTVETMGVV